MANRHIAKMLNITNHQGNANKTQRCEVTPPSHLSEWLSKRTQITNIGKDVEKREPLWECISAATAENSVELFQKITENRATIRPSTSILRIYLKNKNVS